MESYRAAKERLFTELLAAGRVAVLNADSPGIRRGWRRCARSASSESSPTATRRTRNCASSHRLPRPSGQRIAVELFGERHDIDLPLVGGFQAMNVLAALGLVIATGAAPRRGGGGAAAAAAACPAACSWSARPRRGAPVFVDYAHTPDALATVLTRAAAACRAAARRRVRRRRRPRPRQAAADGPGRGRARRSRLCHRRQSAQRGPGGDPPRDPGGGARRDRDRRPARGDRRRDRRAAEPAMCWSSPARATRPGRSSAARSCRSTMPSVAREALAAAAPA